MDKPHTLLMLPPEILPLICEHLDYPDMLSFRLAHPYFYYSELLETDNSAGIRSRVAWFCSVTSLYCASLQDESRRLSSSIMASSLIPVGLRWLIGLLVPLNQHRGVFFSTALRLGTNAEFLSNGNIQKLLRRRLFHCDCRGGGHDCSYVQGMICGGPKQPRKVYTKNWRRVPADYAGLFLKCFLEVWLCSRLADIVASFCGYRVEIGSFGLVAETVGLMVLRLLF
jgi:hypothetical protein